MTVTLEPTGDTTTSNANGLFVFFDVPLVLGDTTFTAVATNADNISSQYTTTITRNQPGLSLVPPVVTAQLADDTGVSALDNITSDDTVTGTITTVNPITSFEAQLDQSTVTQRPERLSGTTFTITPAVLATIIGGPVADGKHTLTLLAKDSNGNVSQPVTISFILLTTPPAPVTPELLASSDTGISDSDGITRDTTPTLRSRRAGEFDRHALCKRRTGRPGDGEQWPGVHHNVRAGSRHLRDDGDRRGCGGQHQARPLRRSSL